MGCGSALGDVASMATLGLNKPIENMISTPKPPAAPDPNAVANAQTGANKQTALWNIELNRVGQSNPFGSLGYTQVGTNPDGSPIYQQTENFGSLGQGLMDQAGKGLSAPLPDFNTSLAHSFDIQRSMLDPVWDRNQSQMETKLTNQGVLPGTEAWTNAMKDFNMNKDYAYQNAQDHAISQAGDIQGLGLQLRNAPLQELQMVRPTFQNYATTQMSAPSVADYIYKNFGAQQDAYNQQIGMNNQLLGAGSQLGAAAMMMGSKALPVAATAAVV